MIRSKKSLVFILREFDANGYFVLAISLAEIPKETEQRSATNRAYYACFITARNAFNKLSIDTKSKKISDRIVVSSTDVHASLIRSTKEFRRILNELNIKYNKQVLSDVEDDLFDLRARRRVADYSDVLPDREDPTQHATESLNLATNILNFFNNDFSALAQQIIRVTK